MMLFLGVASLLISCSAPATVPQTKEAKLVSATNDLAFDLIKSDKTDSNVLISPFSISSALALIYLGASGSTAQAMRHALKYDEYKLTAQEVHDAFRSLLKQINEKKEGYQLSSTNALLVEETFKVLDIYRDALEYYHSVNIENVDFVNKGDLVKDKINALVSEATKGKISNFLDASPDSDVKLFLMNAVYFLGNWENTFDPDATFESTFYNKGVHEKKVQMMSRKGLYDYSISDELQSTVVVLPYKGDRKASMVIVLPNEANGLSIMEQKLTKEALDKAVDGAYLGRINLMLPRFSLEYTANMQESLTRLGLGELFSDQANFSRLASNQSGLKVGRFAHKVVIDVDEKGTQAAAASSAEFLPKSIPPSVTVNHPFMFFIRDDSTGMILFCGRVVEL